MSKDPVCGTEVDERKAKAQGWTAEFGGQMRFFCSAECRDMFQKDPTRHWLPQPTSEVHHKGHHGHQAT
jgi:YHS domain-containing protein